MTDRRLKIGFVIDDLGHGGAQRQLSILTTAMRAHADPFVCSMSEVVTPFAPIIEQGGTPVFEFKRHGSFDTARLRAMTDILQREGADVVHGFLDAANIYAYLAARRIGRPVVLSLRNQSVQLSGVRKSFLVWVLRHADWVITNSSSGRDHLTSEVGLSAERVTLVPNCVDPALLLRTVGARDPERDEPTVETIGFVGRFEPQKRAALLVRAFAILSERRPGVRLTLVGDGTELSEIEQIIGEQGLSDAVTLAGTVSDAHDMIGDFTVLALPSAWEGTPNVAMEALAQGVPVVATPVGDVGQLVQEGRTGWLIDDPSPDGIARTLESALSDRALRDAARTAGPELVRERFSVGPAVDTLMTVYHAVTPNTDPK